MSKMQKENISSIKILSLNVHGWSNPKRSLIIDSDVIEMIDLYSPDICCLQEVKVRAPKELQEAYF